MPAAVEARHDERDIPGIGRLEFVADPRAYWLLPEGKKNRRRLPSVTTILGATWAKPGLLNWYAKHGSDAPRMRDEAAARGTQVHRFVESYLRGEWLAESEFSEDARPYIRGAARFLIEWNPEPLQIEQLVCHPEFGYAGRLDLVALIEGEPMLLDFKTNREGVIYPEAHVQATAYAIASERCGGTVVGGAVLVGVREDGTFNAVIGRDATKVWTATLGFHAAMGKFRRDLEGGRDA